ncbi:MAG TPA: YbaB/EbfC family nucleoid-associated protein [Rhabdochlamydiaceae bacterium]|nr:YbaB/EbfC family nucleoid-associated protein [Rhabdochlamydiaceae bacterium]
MGSGFSKLKKQAKQFESQYAKIQEEMRALEVTGSAGNGLVTLVLNGQHELKDLKIKPACVDPNDVEGLQDLIQAAYADAHAKIQAQTQQGMSGLPF